MSDFLETLRELRRGHAVGDLTDELRGLVAAVKATGGSGALVLTLKIKSMSNAVGDGQLAISDEVKVKLPKTSTGVTVLFADDENFLSRRDPRQPDLKGLRTPASVSDFHEARAAGGEGEGE